MPVESYSMVSGRPKLVVPPGSCDTHMHIYGNQDEYPLAPTSKIDPPLATVEDYKRVQKRLGLQRVVIVQPSSYGFDNRCTLDAMKHFGNDARGVVVVDPGVAENELERLTKLGARGVRFFMLPGGVLPWKELINMADRVKEFGWHPQLQFDGRRLAEYFKTILQLSGNYVIDHIGKFLEPVQVDAPEFRLLLSLVDKGNCWVKLSAPYESSESGAPFYEDVSKLARTLVKSAPERMLWATNWPHPSEQDNLPDEANLLDLLLGWAEDEKVRQRILVDNPAELYGFESTE